MYHALLRNNTNIFITAKNEFKVLKYDRFFPAHLPGFSSEIAIGGDCRRFRRLETHISVLFLYQ